MFNTFNTFGCLISLIHYDIWYVQYITIFDTFNTFECLIPQSKHYDNWNIQYIWMVEKFNTLRYLIHSIHYDIWYIKHIWMFDTSIKTLWWLKHSIHLDGWNIQYIIIFDAFNTFRCLLPTFDTFGCLIAFSFLFYTFCRFVHLYLSIYLTSKCFLPFHFRTYFCVSLICPSLFAICSHLCTGNVEKSCLLTRIHVSVKHHSMLLNWCLVHFTF